jgi:radical SAM protein with 4Fe4S-binding SPASM domain
VLRDRLVFGRATGSFTLQWHLTNACGFDCRHCYDRSTRSELSLGAALRVLDEVQAFCRRRRVGLQVCLTGGDPLCSPNFWPIYEAVASRHLAVTVLGNPIGTGEIARLLAVQSPVYYQVSLEGLEARNDDVRGRGHFARTFNFVALLPDGEVYACRKFPSPIGHVERQGFGAIYDSVAAARYRRGPEGCRTCVIRDSCRGCMAVTCGAGLDPLADRDPGCFVDQESGSELAASSTRSSTRLPAHSVEMRSSILLTPPSGVRT